jgi:peroxiredoxin
MLGLGTAAPDFRLPDATAGGKEVALDDFAAAPALLVAFICNHCPFVQHVAGELAALSRDLPAKGVAMVAISSNDVDAQPWRAASSAMASGESAG